MSDEKQALREEMAQVLCRISGSAYESAVYYARADQIVAALSEAGYAIVPVEPTAAMWASVNLVGRAHVSKLCSIEGWRAMLDAARVAE